MGELGLRARVRVGVALGVVFLLVAAAACGGSGDGSDAGGDGSTATTNVNLVIEPPSAPVSGNTLRFGLGAETASGWDPANSQWAGSASIISRTVFDRLTALDEHSQPQPFLAESLTPNADFTTWDIKLRPGIVFHNGEHLDAAALKVNLDRLPRSILLADYKAIVGVEIVDALTVRVQLSSPWSTLPYSLTSQAGAIAAPEQLRSDKPAEHPIGTGPFVFDGWERDRSFDVNRNPTYWRTDADGTRLPYLDRIEFSILSDPTTRTATLEQGGVDVVESYDPAQIKSFTEAAAAGRFQIYTNQYDEAAAQFVGFNTAAPPFDDLLARQLVVAALDTELTSSGVYLGVFPPATGLFPESSPYHSDRPAPGFDPARATDLAAQYQEKYGKPLAFSLNLPSTSAFRAVGEMAQEQARQFGIGLELNLITESELISDALLGHFQASGLVTFGEPWIDQVFISSTTVAPIGQLSLNFSRYADPQIQAALDAIRATADETEQIRQWGLIQDRMAENLNVMFVVRNRSAVIFADDVFGLQADLPTGQAAKRSTSPYLTETWISR